MIKYFELKQQMCHLHLTTLLLFCSAANGTYLTMNWMGNLSINFPHTALSRTSFHQHMSHQCWGKQKRTLPSCAGSIFCFSYHDYVLQHRRRNPSKESDLSSSTPGFQNLRQKLILAVVSNLSRFKKLCVIMFQYPFLHFKVSSWLLHSPWGCRVQTELTEGARRSPFWFSLSSYST